MSEEAQATLQLEDRIAEEKEHSLADREETWVDSHRTQQVGEIQELNRTHRRRGGIYEDSSHTGCITGME